MAILKMKRLRLMIARSQKDELLRALIRLGCVQFSELEDEVQCIESLHRGESEVLSVKSDSRPADRTDSNIKADGVWQHGASSISI